MGAGASGDCVAVQERANELFSDQICKRQTKYISTCILDLKHRTASPRNRHEALTGIHVWPIGLDDVISTHLCTQPERAVYKFNQISMSYGTISLAVTYQYPSST